MVVSNSRNCAEHGDSVCHSQHKTPKYLFQGFFCGDGGGMRYLIFPVFGLKNDLFNFFANFFIYILLWLSFYASVYYVC